MLYLWPQSVSMAGMHERFGVIRTASGSIGANITKEGRSFAIDNEAFTGRFEPEKFFAFLQKLRPYRENCLFVSCPDGVADAVATLDRYRWWAWRIKALDLPVALVAQDGIELLPWPPEYDALFIGGSTEWKMSDAADWCIAKAKRAGKWIHVGRVNSISRYRHFQLVGADSVDGTFPCFEPDTARRRLTSAVAQPALLQVA